MMSSSDIEVGRRYTLGPELLTVERITSFGKAGGDECPWHLDDEAARAAGFPRAVVHGMLGMALLGRCVTENITEKLSGSRMRLFKTRFAAMAFHGDSLTCSAEVKSVDQRSGTARLDLLTVDQNGRVILTGYAEVEFSPD